MYTGLRFKGFVKEEYREDIELLLNDSKGWNACKHEELLEFAKFDRSRFIPFGALSYMPDCWEGEPYDKENPWDCPDTDGFDRKFNKETGYWSFQCSLKNYEGEIEYFISKIVPLICSKVVHCEEFYEEWDVSNLYELEDGKINELDYGIRYAEEDWFSYGGTKSDKKDKNILYENFDFTTGNKYR